MFPPVKITLISPRLIDHAKQLLEDKEETLCVRVLQTIKGMMARDIDFGDKVRFVKEEVLIFSHVIGVAALSFKETTWPP